MGTKEGLILMALKAILPGIKEAVDKANEEHKAKEGTPSEVLGGVSTGLGILGGILSALD